MGSTLLLSLASLLLISAFGSICHAAAFTSSGKALSRRWGHCSAAATGRCRSSRTSWLYGSISKGDTVLVIGGTGGVGQLVTKKLRGRGDGGDYNVRVSSRDVERAKETLEDDGVDVVRYDLINGSDDDLSKALEGVSAVVVSVGTTAFPTGKWKGGNTPRAIDDVAVTKIAQKCSSTAGMKKIVLLTSVGVYRTDQFPFVILNLFGVLDAKRSGEDAVKNAASSSSPSDGGLDYAIVRPGRLVGGPFTNDDVAKLLQVQGGAENGVDVAVGDSLLGDCKRDACAEAVVQCLINDKCSNVDFSIVSNDQSALSDEQWTSAFSGMQ